MGENGPNPSLSGNPKAKGISAPTLLVLPTTLIFNWKHEIQQFLPSFNTLILEGPNRSDITDRFEELDIVLISYHNLLTDINRLKKLTFNYVILDESQHIKIQIHNGTKQ
nr:SNF2-related protein [Sphingobacterium sp. E70]